MNKLVDHVFYFTGDGEIKDIMGNYTAYHKARIAIQQELAQAKTSANKQIIKETTAVEVKVEEKPEARKLTYKEKLEFAQIEQEIANLEQEKEKLTEKLYDTNLSGEEMNEISMRLSVTIAQIEIKTERWIELSEFQ
jgi:ATP-binding cassette subfamily F protein uup